MYTIRILAFAACLFIMPNAFSKGYTIKIKIKNLKNDTVLLAHYLSKSIYPDDTAILNSNGEGVFKDDELLDGGMYLLFLPNKQYFDILIDKDQEFEVLNDTAGFVENMVVTGDEQNKRFYEYQLFIQNKRIEKEKIDARLKDSTLKETEKEKYKKQIEELNKVVTDYQKKVIAENPGTLLGAFLKALQDVDVPPPPKKEDGTIDSTFQYFYYKDHFFDNFDFTDSRMLRTPIYENKIMQYVTGVIPQIPDSIIKGVDMILSKSLADENLLRFNLIKLFNYYAKSNVMGFDAVHLFIGEKYYLKYATWSDSAFNAKLTEYINDTKPTLIGNIAPDIEMIVVPKEHFLAAANDTLLKKFVHAGKKLWLHEVPSRYTVLAFWEKDCGHCRKSMPELYKLYEQRLKDKDVTILAFHMLFGEEGKIKWIDFVNEHKMYDWVNVWNPYSYTFKQLYNIKSTPQIFVLDKNKKIIAKRIGPEQVVEIIEEMIAKGK